MTTELTKELAYKSIVAFFDYQPFVLFGTGTSCAVDSGFGMPLLREYLLKEIPKASLSTSEKQEWDTVVDNLKKGYDLESAMDVVQNNNLIKRIVNTTAILIAALDYKYSRSILAGKTIWPATGLFKRLVEGLPPLAPMLHVATPNYDLLAEYAFEKEGLPYTTGFYGGVCRNKDWKQAECALMYKETTLLGKSARGSWRLKKHIRLYKVHGSLNTFKVNNSVVENNSWIYECPSGIDRLMITPGMSKYQKLHESRADLLGEYDRAVNAHKAFLFVGFGFNDNQLCNDAIKRKLKDQRCPGLIITRNSTPGIDAFIKDCENLWLICSSDPSGIDGTLIHNSRYDQPLILKGIHLWDTAEFTKELLGG